MTSLKGTEERRELMIRVEHMVAEAEALYKTDEEVHVSDASSDEGEGQFVNMPHVSPILNIVVDKSLSQSTRNHEGDVTPRFGNRRRNGPHMALTDEIELEAFSAHRSSVPQDKPSIESILSKARLDSSIASDKSVTSTHSTTNNTTASLNSYRGAPVDSVCSKTWPDHSITPSSKSVMTTPYNTKYKPQYKPPIESILSKARLHSSIASDKSVTSTHSTPNKTTASFNSYRGAPVDSVCSKAWRDHSIISSSKYVITTPYNAKDKGASINLVCSTGRSDHSSVPSGNKSVASKASSINSSTTPHSTYKGMPINSPLNSSPFFVNSSSFATPESTSAVQKSSSQKKRLEMKKEIEDLTAQFETLDKDTKKQNAKSSSKKENFVNAEKAFEEGLDIMGRKTDLMIDAFQKSVSYSKLLERDCDNLRNHLRIIGKEKSSESPPLIPCENTRDVRLENHVSVHIPEQTVSHLNPSNECRKRQYPPIPATPGTLFVSEVSEVLDLDVGDHAYLSKLMDRQWGSSLDYVHS